MRAVLGGLNAEFERLWGVSLRTRTGVNTGEVIATDPRRGQSFVAGDAVNTAARLEQAAEPGEILVGEATYRLIRDAVVVAAADPFTLKGKAEPVSAVRLLEVGSGPTAWSRRLDSPIVGRAAELALLEAIFARSAGERTANVITVVAPAGAGKSRLSAEFASRLAGAATVIRGRCLPYGEGITFWPIVEVLRDAGGIGDRDPAAEARAKIAELLPGEGEATVIRERLSPLLGLAPAKPGIQETFWAVRKLFEHLARDRPLVVVFDDIQWGEATFIDLLEYIADWIRVAPVVVVCLARPELLEVRPGWMAAKPNATLIRLEPLTEAETDGLIQNLVGPDELVRHARARIAEVAEGNPLFVEEVLRMLVDDGLLRRLEGGWAVAGDLAGVTIPPTIHALLAARLDRLAPADRTVIQRASVIGRVFWWEEILELSPEALRPTLTHHLQSLSRKELVRPDHSQTVREDTFRFAHILIRDAAYQGIPKSERADLHERFADWMEERAQEHVGEYEEIRGYHFEQAHRALLSLGPANERTDRLGRRASATLAAAGRRAFARGDMPAAVNLLNRAASLLGASDPERLELSLQLAFALLETGDFGRLDTVLGETTAAAAAAGAAGVHTHAAILRLWMRLSTEPEGWADEARVEAENAIAAFRSAGDERGLAKGWSLLGLVHNMNGRFGPAEEAWTQAAAHAHNAGDQRDELESLSWVPLMVLAGPTHVELGVPRCVEILGSAAGDKKAMASALTAQAVFVAGLGRFDEARELIGRARALLQDVGLTVWLAGPHAQFAGWIELLAGDPAAAEDELRWGYRKLEQIGELGWLSTVVALLAEAVYLQGRRDEATALARLSEESAGTEDVYSQVLWRGVRAKVLAAGGERVEAERLAGEAAALAGTTDFLLLRWHALMNQAEVQLMADDGPAAEAALIEAIGLAAQKGNVVAEARARDLLARARSSAQA